MKEEQKTAVKPEKEEEVVLVAVGPRLIKRALRRIQLEQVNSRGELTTWIKC